MQKTLRNEANNMLNLLTLANMYVDRFDKIFVSVAHILAMVIGIVVLRSILWTIGLLLLALLISAVVVIGKMVRNIRKGIRTIDSYQTMINSVFSHNVQDHENKDAESEIIDTDSTETIQGEDVIRNNENKS
jgi:ABC-type multidrug transport system fused ATPase/permease subunit